MRRAFIIKSTEFMRDNVHWTTQFCAPACHPTIMCYPYTVSTPRPSVPNISQPPLAIWIQAMVTDSVYILNAMY